MAKKKSNGSGSIRKREDGRWEGRYTAGRNPETGKLIRRSIYGATKSEVDEKLEKALREIRYGIYIGPIVITVGEWAKIWLQDYLINVKPHTIKSYTSILDNYILPELQNIRLQQLDKRMVQQFINKLWTRADTGNQLSAKTVKNIHGVLHAMLEQAKYADYINYNPADHTTLPKCMKPEIFPLQDHQVFVFLEMIQGHELEDLYIVALFTGLRQSELVGLRWCDVDFAERELIVRRQLQFLGGEQGYVPSAPKNWKARIVPLPQKAITALERQKLRQEQRAQRLGVSWMNDENLVFTDPLGRHVKHDYIYRKLKKVFKAMGVPNLRFHDLRHTYAVTQLRAGVDPKTVQENMGHHSVAFTLDTYCFVTKGMRQECAKRLDAYFAQSQYFHTVGDFEFVCWHFSRAFSRLDNLERKMLNSALLSSHRRLALTLLELSEHAENRTENTVQISVTQQELSNMLSLTRQTIGTCIKEFQDKGILQTKRGKIEIYDLKALRAEMM